MRREQLAMGSPLSCILAEIFLNNLENMFLWNEEKMKTYKVINNIVFYFRYMDDTILLFNGCTRQLNILKNYWNEMHLNWQFTVEEKKQIDKLPTLNAKHDGKQTEI